METLNLAQTRGFGTGGTVHIIINNQIGFTTSDLRDTRSTLYCSDVSKMIEAPIFHVNARRSGGGAVWLPRSRSISASSSSKDVVVDLVCYRRLGHNEQDEPMVTQPLMYKAIHQHPTPRKIYADKLVARGRGRRGRTRRNGQDLPQRARRRLSHQQDDPVELPAAVRGELEAVHRHASGTRTTTRDCRSRRCSRSAARSPRCRPISSCTRASRRSWPTAG